MINSALVTVEGARTSRFSAVKDSNPFVILTSALKRAQDFLKQFLVDKLIPI